jgi:predicted phage baseplate assembly protein
MHALTISNEVLGSSDASANQTFRTLKQPVLPGQQLAVLEQSASSAAQAPEAAWITWNEVSDFHGSQPLDRHYVLNRQTGEIRFGDGQSGMIPPRGARTVRMTQYRVGGGAVGNVPAGALKALASGSQSIARVTNLFAATAGADVEQTAALIDRAPRSLRHRMRAVTQEDYEDLSKLASTEVARALCVPLQDLAANAAAPYVFIDTVEEEKAGVGKVSVIVVPHSTDKKPLPTPDLMRRVQSYLSERASAGASVTVVGPLYLSVKVQVDVRLRSLRWKDTVERDLQALFASFLHPLTGNHGAGWPFGRRPQASDLYPEIAKVNGIAYVSNLTIKVAADDDFYTQDTLRTARFLVYSGEHEVRFVTDDGQVI